MGGEPTGFFKSTRGVSQGDPLSPALFIIAEEVLSRGLRALFMEGRAEYYSLPRGCPGISHSLFADDTIIFSSGLKSSLKQICGLINSYEGFSGQLVNKSKSYFVISEKASNRKSLKVEGITGFPRKRLPITYLGEPLFSGRLRICFFNEFLAKMRNRVAGWQRRTLFSGGRVVLLKHVLAAMSIHVVSSLDIPTTIQRKFNGIYSDFLWGQSEWGKRHHWVSWSKVCAPVAEGGLGIRNLEDMTRALRLKGLWRAMTGKSLWCKFL
ncbi:uncharacterized protein LOC122655405 [Telopea speciosissima]|uniref:uncharacterized protein LOC122655405 n=1 Tax=Telopea speciosissima TaxID=54955 RepID=UPI001CC506E4|nr:uncharacterized protein LOC122655405 [Telopea speciosissima]